MPHRFLIFTDLDGTLLDHDTYSFDRALPALRLLDKENIPLVINTSKSRGEIERYRSLLGNTHPFVSENGGGIFIPDGCFSRKFRYDRASGGYLVIEPGTPREELRDVLKSVADETGIRKRPDMSLSDHGSYGSRRGVRPIGNGKELQRTFSYLRRRGGGGEKDS
jgi:HAD superfamily hydrolase (TIGR01484 family)